VFVRFGLGSGVQARPIGQRLVSLSAALLLAAIASLSGAPGIAHAANGAGATWAEGSDQTKDAKRTKHGKQGKRARDAKAATADVRAKAARDAKRGGDTGRAAKTAGAGKHATAAKNTKRAKDSRANAGSMAPRRGTDATAPAFGPATGPPPATTNALSTLQIPENGIPVIQSIDIQRHAPAGGLTIAIIGQNFPEGEFGTVTINGQTTSAISDWDPDSGGFPEQVRAQIPPGTLGTVTDVILTFSNGASIPNAASKIYYVTTPSVSSLNPTSGPVTGGGNITIGGSGFIGAKEVRFGATAASSFTVNSANQITAVIPALAQGSHSVTVTHGYVGLGLGNIATLTSMTTPPMTTFTALPAGPVITSLTPANGLATGGTNVVIAGDRFTDANAVTFGGVGAASYVVNSDEQITAVSPPGTAGTASVVVTTPEGSSTAGESSTFTYTVPPAVTTHPSNQAVTAGATATFTASANGTGPVTVQWQLSTDSGSTWNNVPAATNTTLQVANTAANQNGHQYRAVFSNVTGVPATTNTATLTVNVVPEITTHPSDHAVTLDATATFTASANGTGPVTVQWQLSTDSGSTWNNVPAATNTTLQVANTTANQNGHQYRAVFNNVTGVPATTNTATLTVNSPPTVTTHPTNQSATAGTTATFTAAASGTGPITVQWQLSTDSGSTWNNVPAATNTTLQVASTTENQDSQYRAVFSNITGVPATTNAATITVNAVPAITTHPASQAVTAGAAATFTAAASGTAPLTVQWQQSTNGGGTWTNIPGATATTHGVSTTAEIDGYQYRAVFTNITAQAATTDAATLTVYSAPTVTLQPANQTVAAGAAATFTVAASGTDPITVQWQVSTNGGGWVNVPGATSLSFGFTATLADNGNQYRAVLNNITGQQATSSAATLTISDVPDAPTGVTATANDSSITVSWQPSVTHGADVTGYTATASSGGATCSTPAEGTSCVLGATAGMTVTVTVVARSAIGNSAPSAASNQVTPPAPVPPAAPPATTLTLTTDQGIISTADPGEEIVFIGTGFAAFSTVVMTLYSEPIVLGTVVTDAQGSFRKAVTVPVALLGSHTMVAQGVAPDGTPRAMKLAITVAVSGQGGGLAVTGSAVFAVVLLGLALSVVGAVLRFGRRRAQ
jgi:hypothetical protein